MPDIIKLTGHLLADDGILLAMKGQNPIEELAVIDAAYQLIPLTVPGIDAERCLIRIERLKYG
jgi:16S rRNA (guanine527-N7)-methyltransferase